MTLNSQKNIAARILKCGRSRIWFDPARIGDIKEAITANDVRRLIKDDVIKALPKRGISSYRRKKIIKQLKKGRRRGKGTRKGKLGTRMPRKRVWIQKIRALRNELRKLRSEGRIEKRIYRNIYMKAKGGLFRSRSHLLTYLEKNDLLKKTKEEKTKEK
jgi:large subunit ribosomal protein L19e